MSVMQRQPFSFGYATLLHDVWWLKRFDLMARRRRSRQSTASIGWEEMSVIVQQVNLGTYQHRAEGTLKWESF